mmetsp:Transcript_6002/g.13244  ORF Transcript_6002/g.13244 Transcript_6002/m.13244 type:complete len:207 (+) Transcript_6002:240-860(+)
MIFWGATLRTLPFASAEGLAAHFFPHLLLIFLVLHHNRETRPKSEVSNKEHVQRSRVVLQECPVRLGSSLCSKRGQANFSGIKRRVLRNFWPEYCRGTRHRHGVVEVHWVHWELMKVSNSQRNREPCSSRGRNRDVMQVAEVACIIRVLRPLCGSTAWRRNIWSEHTTAAFASTTLGSGVHGHITYDLSFLLVMEHVCPISALVET